MRGTPFLHDGFVGGLNTISDPYGLDPSEARDLLNVVSTQRGSIRKRYGSTMYGEAPAVELKSLFSGNIGGTPFLLVAGGGKMWVLNSAGVLTELGSGFVSDEWTMVEAPTSTEVGGQGPVYMTNGTNSRYYNGAVLGNWTGKVAECYEDPTYKEHVPKGKYMIFAGNRVWSAGIATDPSAVWFSEDVPIGEGGEQADPSFWPKTNVVRFDSSDQNPITGIGTVGPYILVFKERKTWVIHNLDTGENRKLSDSVGCVAHRSITSAGTTTFFLTADQGVYLTNGSSLTEMSYTVRPTILAINPKQRANAAGAYFNNHYYLSYASGLSETPNRTLDYDTQLKSWWLHDLAGWQWAQWEPTIPGPANLVAIPAGSSKGVVKAFVEGIYTDSAANYAGEAFWKSSWEPFAQWISRHRIKSPMVKKRVRQVWFAGEGQIETLIYKDFGVGGRQEPAVVGNIPETEPENPVDFAAASEKWGESPEKWGEATGVEALWGGETEIGQARIYAPGVANVWGVGFGNNSDRGFTVNAIMWAIVWRKS